MAVSYKKLWKLLIDKDMKKKRPLRSSRHQPCVNGKSSVKMKMLQPMFL